MRQYELMYIIPAKLEEEEKKAIIEKVSKMLADHKAAVQDHEVWLTRKLSYPIKHIRQGVFVLAHFTMDPEDVPALNLELQRDGDILRHIIIHYKGEITKTKPQISQAKPAPKTKPTDTKEDKEVVTSDVKLEDLDKKIEEILEEKIDV